jgi:hypothetical protein
MPRTATRQFCAYRLVAACCGLLALAASRPAHAASSTIPGTPQLGSNPGAAYTIYLDFGGFNFTGTWDGETPGVTPAYSTDADATTFTTVELSNIQQIWARAAQKFVGFSVNVTTVDPAVAAGQAGSDSTRQAYYDSQAKIMHTVIGGTGIWNGGGGVSYVGLVQNAYNPASFNGGAGAGFHTDFVFAGLSSNNTKFIGEATAHENGHGLGLNHQSDFNGTALVNEYSTNNDASGNGSYAPIMGASYQIAGHTNNAQRGVWRSGTSDASSSGAGIFSMQNDVATIMQNPAMTYVDDSVGHSRATATPLALSGSTVNPSGAHGWITPISTNNPNPIGAGNYTTDFFSFTSDGINPVSLTVNDGTDFLTPGVADPGITLASSLLIRDNAGNIVGTVVTAADTLSETFSGLLSAGTYFAEVESAGGYTSTFDPSAQYYNMGAFFITGAVPEPASLMLMIPLVSVMLRRLRRD